MMWVDKAFDRNDYFVIAIVIVSWLIFFIMPKVFSKQVTVLIFLYTVTAAGVFDNSIGAVPFDFYDIMDGPAYSGMDVIVYLLYPPFGYFFLYLYHKFKVGGFYILLFISLWTAAAITIEWVYNKMGVFHYKNGNNIFYSICTYLVVQSLLVVYYHMIKEKQLEKQN